MTHHPIFWAHSLTFISQTAVLPNIPLSEIVVRPPLSFMWSFHDGLHNREDQTFQCMRSRIKPRGTGTHEPTGLTPQQEAGGVMLETKPRPKLKIQKEYDPDWKYLLSQ